MPFGNYPCSLCAKTFNWPGDRSRHYKSVHEKVKVTCTACDKQFTRGDNMARHMQKHKPKPSAAWDGTKGPKKQLCALCHARFVTWEELQCHLKVTHRVTGDISSSLVQAGPHIAQPMGPLSVVQVPCCLDPPLEPEQCPYPVHPQTLWVGPAHYEHVQTSATPPYQTAMEPEQGPYPVRPQTSWVGPAYYEPVQTSATPPYQTTPEKGSYPVYPQTSWVNPTHREPLPTSATPPYQTTMEPEQGRYTIYPQTPWVNPTHYEPVPTSATLPYQTASEQGHYPVYPQTSWVNPSHYEPISPSSNAVGQTWDHAPFAGLTHTAHNTPTLFTTNPEDETVGPSAAGSSEQGTRARLPSFDSMFGSYLSDFNRLDEIPDFSLSDIGCLLGDMESNEMSPLLAPEVDPEYFDASLVGSSDDAVVAVYRREWSKIRSRLPKNRWPVTTFNYRLPLGYTIETLADIMNRTFEYHHNVFKVNFAFGLLLQHKITGQLSYWYPEKNSLQPEVPVMITNRVELDEVTKVMQEFDPNQYAIENRPDTQNELHSVTNVTVYTYSLGKGPVGSPMDVIMDAEVEEESTQDEEIRRYIKTSKSIYSFYTDHNGRKYRDNLCFFRCLASQLSGRMNVTKAEVKDLYVKWTTWCGDHQIPSCSISEFAGVDILEDISNLEDCFKINIFVYTLVAATPMDADQGDIYEILAEQEIRREMGVEEEEELEHEGLTAQILARSMKLYDQHMHLNLNFDHFSRITNIQRYVKYWRCQTCDRIVNRKNNYLNHLKLCTGSIRKVYPGGGFGNRPTIFEKLQDEGILLEDSKKFYPFRIVFDFECRFENLQEDPRTSLMFEKRLVPVSVSIMSNVPSFDTPVCIVEEDPVTLVNRFVEYLNKISEAAVAIMVDAYHETNSLIIARAGQVTSLRNKVNELHQTNAATARIERLQYEIKETDYWENLSKEWERWLKQIPVLGFNSAKFDLNLIKQHLLPAMMRDGDDINAIKRGSSYLILSTDNLLFMDVTNFLAQGTSYASWLAGFGVQEKKGVFPYEWLTDFGLLNQTELPPKEAFFSSLRQSNISDEEYNNLKDTWVTEGFATMKDLLIWYNNKDVEPFMLALKKMWDIFREMRIDMLKSGCISLPGVAQVHMFNSLKPDVVFQIFNEENKEYRDLIQQNIVGGPAIIFKRLAVAGHGRIKNTGPKPKAVLGFDANGLYSWSLAQEMPTGIGIKWEPVDTCGQEVPSMASDVTASEAMRTLNDNMKLRYHRAATSRGHEELIVVNILYQMVQRRNPNQELTLKHKFNGKQKVFRFGKRRIPVDGWIPQTRTIIQYHGCYYHGHECQLTTRMDPRLKQQNRERTEIVTGLLRQTGCELIEMRQCEFYHLKKTKPPIRAYAQSFEMRDGRRALSMRQIVDELKSGAFFGMVEVDIQVPYWDESLRQSMAELPPIFKNIEISIDDIGEHMKQFAETNKSMNQPRRSLIASYFAKKMLIATPLLKWYLDHGLIITRIYRALQYLPFKAFEHLPEEVAQHRRRADNDPNLAAYGLLFKLMGNSYYGKCLTDKEKHRVVKYCNRKAAAIAICSPRFRKMEFVTEGLYEAHMGKGQVVFDLPVNIAYFVYANAKLRMLQFYYDFLVKVLPYDHFELLEMDTDSFYMAIAEDSLENTSKTPDLFEDLKKSFLVCTDFDKKTPGLFKLEWKGKGMVSLCPKTYIAFDDDDGSNTKMSTKGLSKRTNEMTLSDFKKVLESKEPVSGVNRGFRTSRFDLCQYAQRRVGLTYLYIKRRVEPDGITTAPIML